ncbi:tetratricopeptide repeat protein [Alkalicoccobacillus gibsonii]|uniref:tetratricopeptide repeat protein n=1 Tax=Alkalicoccobacillus gibsonii TaxID=79881 RepID=UPI003F7C62FB
MFREAITHLDHGEYKKAQTLLLTLVKEKPNEAELQFYLASTYDGLGQETEAIPHYQQAIELGLTGINYEKAYVQLGSSLRCIGKYAEAEKIFHSGLKEFPKNAALSVFLAITEYNLGHTRQSTQRLLTVLMEEPTNDWLQTYKKALTFYAAHLDETWTDTSDT